MTTDFIAFPHLYGGAVRVSRQGTVALPMKTTRGRTTSKPPALTGPRERIGQMLVRLRQLEGNPHNLALGMAIGIFVSITPIIPFQTIVAIALAFLVRGSKSAAVLGSWLSNPLTIPVVYYANYKLGCALLGYHNSLDRIAFTSFSELMALGLEVTWAMIVGGVAIGAFLGVVIYFVTLRAITTFRRQSVSTDSSSGPDR